MHPTISRSLALIILSVTPVMSVAQSAAKAPRKEPIPRELVLALLSRPGMAARIRVEP
jgi:hypothetical protein